jgi:hypothetical protein
MSVLIAGEQRDPSYFSETLFWRHLIKSKFTFIQGAIRVIRPEHEGIARLYFQTEHARYKIDGVYTGPYCADKELTSFDRYSI